MDKEFLHLGNEIKPPSGAYLNSKQQAEPDNGIGWLLDSSFNMGIVIGSDAAFRIALELAIATPDYAKQVLNDLEAYTECMKVVLEGFDVPEGQIEATIRTRAALAS